MRVASLLPSATEIVCAIAGPECLVGVSHECDHPSGVEGLPSLTRTRAALPRASGAIDRAIRDLLEDALTVYEVEIDRLRETAPDVIVTQDLCDVCAVSLADVHRALAELVREDVQVVSLKPTKLADVWEDVRRVGRALQMAERGEAVARALEDRVQEVAARATALSERPSVLTIEWLDPVMIGGTWMPELVTLAGGRPLVTEAGQHAPTLTREELAALDPDVVLIKPCGFELARTAEEFALLPEVLPFESWSAIDAGRLFVADGNAFFNRPGPRLVESLEILAACLHPAGFPDLAERHRLSVHGLTRGLETVALTRG